MTTQENSRVHVESIESQYDSQIQDMKNELWSTKSQMDDMREETKLVDDLKSRVWTLERELAESESMVARLDGKLSAKGKEYDAMKRQHEGLVEDHHQL